MENGIVAVPKKAGRPKGALNKSTAEVKKAAQKYTEKALKTLALIMEKGQTEPARVAAARELLDRAHGKPAQPVQHAGEDGGPIAIANLSDSQIAARLELLRAKQDDTSARGVDSSGGVGAESEEQESSNLLPE